jgi:hypothetical protein
MKDYVPILITLPAHLVSKLDQASEALGWTRMALIRRCIIRDMQFVLQQEVPRIISATESDDHGEWLDRTASIPVLIVTLLCSTATHPRLDRTAVPRLRRLDGATSGW